MDTNVAVVANGKTPQAGLGCVRLCIEELAEIHARRRMLIDDQRLILEEYRQHLSPGGQPGPGDAFFKWLWDNQRNPRYCEQIAITPTDDNGQSFAEFPDDPLLVDFDHSDRKFVAVALASGECPPICNAADTDWWEFRQSLSRHGIEVRFLCPELMNRGR
jgi:hypothetical protein